MKTQNNQIHVPAFPIKSVFVRTPYNYDTSAASRLTGLSCPEPTRTRQDMKDECDINVIVERFGLMPPIPLQRLPSYEDFSEVVDFHTAANAIALAREAFDRYPAHIRDHFHNDPGRFVDFCSDSGNRQDAIKLGLIPTPPAPSPVPQTAPIASPDPLPSK